MRSSRCKKRPVITGKVDHIALLKTASLSFCHSFRLQGREETFLCRVVGGDVDWHIGLTLAGDRVRFQVADDGHVVERASFVNLEI